MNKGKNFIYVVDAIIWYFFFYYLLFAIENAGDLWVDSLVLLILAYAGVWTCPWTRKFEKHIDKKK